MSWHLVNRVGIVGGIGADKPGAHAVGDGAGLPAVAALTAGQGAVRRHAQVAVRQLDLGTHDTWRTMD